MASRRTAAVLALLAATALAGCGAGRTAPPSAPTVAAAQADLRKVVYTAGMQVRVDDAGVAARDASRITTSAGGVVMAVTTAGRSARLQLKVPPERFEPVMDELAALGASAERDVKAQDVTEEFVDLDGRLRTAQTSVDRLRTLLAEARTTADLVVIEAELAKREGDLEALQGKVRVLNSRVDFATINLKLSEEARFGTALRAGWDALATVARSGVVAAGYLLPFAPLAFVAAVVVHRQRRRSVSSRVS